LCPPVSRGPMPRSDRKWFVKRSSWPPGSAARRTTPLLCPVRQIPTRQCAAETADPRPALSEAGFRTVAPRPVVVRLKTKPQIPRPAQGKPWPESPRPSA